MNKKITVHSVVSFIGFILMAAGILWERQTEKSNVISGHDDINIIAGYMTVIGFLFIFIPLMLLLVSYFVRNKRKD